MTRYKIDVWEGYKPFAIFRENKIGGFLWGSESAWEFIASFNTRDEAKAHYETIKDLPEYLGGGL